MMYRDCRGRLLRDWLDDINDWCGKDVHILSLEAQDRVRRRKTADSALNTYNNGLIDHTKNDVT